MHGAVIGVVSRDCRYGYNSCRSLEHAEIEFNSDLANQSESDGMNMFRGFMNDRVTLVKKNGQRFENLPASVQPGLILTQDPNIPIEDGDEFERRTLSGIIETFLIVDAGFHQPFHHISAHYQSKIRKNTPGQLSAQQPQIVYNVSGLNARVNIQSTDSSTNVINVESAALFDKLRNAIQESIKDTDVVKRLAEQVDAMQAAAGTRSFAQQYQEFISVAADHLTLFLPLLPALTQLLS
jgi:hypothetical protein